MSKEYPHTNTYLEFNSKTHSSDWVILTIYNPLFRTMRETGMNHVVYKRKSPRKQRFSVKQKAKWNNYSLGKGATARIVVRLLSLPFLSGYPFSRFFCPSALTDRETKKHRSQDSPTHTHTHTHTHTPPTRGARLG